MNYEPSTKKNTWWNKKRIDNHMTFSDIEDLIGVPKETLCKHFSGEVMPTDGRIKILCNMFDVDFDEGKEHFKRACDNYKPNKRTPKVIITTMSKKELNALKKAEEKEKVKNMIKEENNENKEENDNITWLNKLRVSKKYTLDEIFKGTGISRAQLSKIFNGRLMPKKESIESICSFFSMDFEECQKHIIEDYDRMRQNPDIRVKPAYAKTKKDHNTNTIYFKGGQTTWWNSFRIKKGLSHSDFANLFPTKSKASITGYVVGRSKIPKALSDQICDHFNIDREEGYKHFLEGYKGYLYPEEKSNINLIDDTKTNPEEHYIPVEPKPYNWSYGEQSSKNIAILKKIYGLVEYDIFREVEKGLTDMNADIFGILYSKIPYDIFIEIAKEFKYE